MVVLCDLGAAAGDGLLGCAAVACCALPALLLGAAAPPLLLLLAGPAFDPPEPAGAGCELELVEGDEGADGWMAAFGFVPTETEPTAVVAETVAVTGSLTGGGGSETVVVAGGGGGGGKLTVVVAAGGGRLTVVAGGGGGGSATVVETVVETVAVVIGVLNVTVGVLTEMVGRSSPQDEATNPCETRKPSRLVETSARTPPIRRLKPRSSG